MPDNYDPYWNEEEPEEHEEACISCGRKFKKVLFRGLCPECVGEIDEAIKTMIAGFAADWLTTAREAEEIVWDRAELMNFNYFKED